MGAVPRSSSVPSLEQLCRTSWRRETRSLKCEKPRGSRLFVPPRTRRKPPSRSPLSRTRLRRRHKRQQRMSRRPGPEGLVARDKYFVMAICSIKDCPACLKKKKKKKIPPPKKKKKKKKKKS